MKSLCAKARWLAYNNFGYAVSTAEAYMRSKSTKMKDSTTSATVRLPTQMHHALKVALAQRGDTLIAVMVRAAARYLDEHEGPKAERQKFMDTAVAFYRVATPETREGFRIAMEEMTMNSKR